MKKSSPARRFLMILAALGLGSAGTGLAASPPIDPADADSQWRWIGLLSDGALACPEPPEGPSPSPSPTTPSDPEGEIGGTTFRYKSPAQPWATRKLFDGSSDMELDRFCVYEYEADLVVDPNAVDRLEELVPGLLDRVEPDRMAVAGAGVLGDQLWPSLEGHFHRQAGRLRESRAVVAPLPAPAGNARLAVLDTAPTSETPLDLEEGCSPHAVALLQMAEDLICFDDDCLAKITSRLALAYKEFDSAIRKPEHRNEEDGGVIGLIGELAEAIAQEVSDALLDDPETRLVLNVSAAWDAELFGGLEPAVDEMPLAVQAVYRALESASCRGALVIAAAGNKSCGPQASCGPFLPAAWEQRPAPGCVSGQASASPAAAPWKSPLSYRALVYAVGSVDGMGRSTSTTLPGGYAALQAYGDHAVVEGTLPGRPTATLTGSSVATLVVSAAAAAARAYRPGWGAHRVIERLYQQGDSLDRAPEFCLGGPDNPPCSASRPIARRVSVCPALAAACSGCVTCPEWQPSEPQLPPISFTPDLVLWIDDPLPCPGEACGGVAAPAAQGPPAVDVPGDPSAYCPPLPYHCRSKTPWVFPQPNTDLCPHCGGGGGGSNLRVGGKLQAIDGASIYVEIEDDHGDGGGSAFVLRDPILRLCGVYYPMRSAGVTLRPGDTALIHGVPDGGCRRMELLFTVDDGSGQLGSTVSSLLVGHYP